MVTDWKLYWPWPLHTTTGQQRTLLRLLAVAAEERIAPAPLLTALAGNEHGLQVSRLRRVVARLEQGDSLADSVARVPGVLSEEDTITVRFGAQTGALAPAIRRRLDQLRSEESPRLWGVLRKASVYFLIFAVIYAFSLSILPSLGLIIDEFKLTTRLEDTSAWRLGSFCREYWWVALLIGLAPLVVIWSRRVRGWLRWLSTLPLGLPQSRATAGVMQHLSTAAVMGRPLAGALSTLARYHYDPVMRGNLLFARNELEQGAELWPTLQEVGLISPAEGKVLRLSDRLDNRAWALHALSRTRSNKTTRRLETAAACLTPLILLAAGCVVYLNANLMFVWTCELVQALALPQQSLPR